MVVVPPLLVSAPAPPEPVFVSEPVVELEFEALVMLVPVALPLLLALVGVALPVVAVAPGPPVALVAALFVGVVVIAVDDDVPPEPEVGVSPLLDEGSPQPVSPAQRPIKIGTVRRFAKVASCRVLGIGATA